MLLGSSEVGALLGTYYVSYRIGHIQCLIPHWAHTMSHTALGTYNVSYRIGVNRTEPSRSSPTAATEAVAITIRYRRIPIVTPITVPPFQLA